MIDVLLATYRPDAEMLKAQKDSILSQKGVEVNLIAREDERGEGAAGNFSALLRRSQAPYVALSDQDDVWCPGKLATSMGKMRELEERYGEGTPLLVFTDGYVTDASLAPVAGTVLSRQRVDVEKGLRFGRLLMQNFIAGNAMLFNAALREKAGEVPKAALMHDVWLALVAAAYGKIGFVDEPLYFYRQHGKNAVGATEADARHHVARAKEGAAAFRERMGANIRQAQAFVGRFGKDAPAEAIALATLYDGGWLARRLAIVRHGLFKQGIVRNLALMTCM